MGAIALVVIVGGCDLFNRPPTPSSSPSPSPVAAVAGTLGPTLSGETAPPTQEPTPTSPAVTPTPADTPTPTPPSVGVAMPFVPVVSFWSTENGISMDELSAAAQGQGSRRLIVPTEDAQV